MTFASAGTGGFHDVIDEITRRAWLSDVRVMAIRNDDVPGRGAVAAILRYAL